MARSSSVFPEAAARLAAIIPRGRLDAAVLAWADAAPRRRLWGVALSGGADSLALLFLLWGHWPERRRFLRALHFNHRLRGRESRRDEDFCRRVCAALGVEFVVGRWRGDNVGASEAAAREARMAFLNEQARTLWFGHQQDDIAESMLMRLSRGSGTAGLAAPRPVQVMEGGRTVRLRPLLSLKKAEVLVALRQCGVRWREDSSNAAQTHFRNRIRHTVVRPWEEAARRDAVAGAAASRRLLEEDDAALEGWLDAVAPIDARDQLRLGRLKGRPRALWRRALHRWLGRQREAGAISRQAFEALLEAIEAGHQTRQSLGRAGFAVVSGAILRFEPGAKTRREERGRAN